MNPLIFVFNKLDFRLDRKIKNTHYLALLYKFADYFSIRNRELRKAKLKDVNGLQNISVMSQQVDIIPDQ